MGYAGLPLSVTGPNACFNVTADFEISKESSSWQAVFKRSEILKTDEVTVKEIKEQDLGPYGNETVCLPAGRFKFIFRYDLSIGKYTVVLHVPREDDFNHIGVITLK